MNTNSHADSSVDDPRLIRAAQEYLAELESGRKTSRGEFISRHPDIAAELDPYLDALEMVMVGSGAPKSRSGTGRLVVDTSAHTEPLGDFRIVREIGRGGMGVVYEAVQLSLGRRVALKVLPFASALDAKQLQRFQNEAQAAAHLHHTNIVPVYAVGCERGVHYYAMQLIEGLNLADLIRQMRPSAPGGDPEPTGPFIPATAAVTATVAELSTRQATHSADFYKTAASLIAQAADALDHAHQLGVIHRDIKPANLLVDGRGNIWVTDFGLAQFHNGASLTHTGDMMGTLRYMSPEQASGVRIPLDPRTDVYSLGATLYELLTLQPLFDGADHQRLLRQILNEEPRLPRSVDRSIPAELETIVLKAVSKIPGDRYATAQDFGEDLRRFLTNRPIHARRPTMVQLVKKWGRRHPSFVAAAVILLVLVAGVSVVSAAIIRGEQAKAEARAEEAEARFKLAVRFVDEMFQVSVDELADKPYLESLRKRLLESALINYQELIEQSRDKPAAQTELRSSRARVEKILADLAVLQGAGQLYLLGQDSVLADLRVSDALRSKVVDLSHKLDRQRNQTFGNFAQLSVEERRQRFLDLARATDMEVKAILSQTQLQRLGQIALQLQGPSAFRETEIATKLQLTAEQKDQIRAIEAETFLPPERKRPGTGGPSGGVGPNGPGPEEAKRNHELRVRAAVEKIVALLTPEQASKWEEMIGNPFRGTVTGRQPIGPR